MSTTVDQRIVQMRFDNSQFQSAIADTQSSVKKFNKSLNDDFSDNASGLDKLGDTADKVRVKFDLWDAIKFSALSRVISDLTGQVEGLVKSLSVDQIASGWNKFAEKTTAVQQMMSALHGTGATIEDVEGQLEKLNWFADETSYSFTQMTSNAGKFIAAGVGLESAVTAMQGISTWAALSGANTEAASRAMYNLSQAMGMGSVRTQDWMSIENANMATKEFKEMAIAAGRLKGTLKVDNDGITYAPNTKKGVDVTAENFRSTLSEGWFTSEVLEEVLNQYGKAADILASMQDLSGVDTTSELLKYVFAYKEATDDAAKEDTFNEFIKAQRLDAKDDADAIAELRKQFNLLSTSEYDLSVRAFRAAQEAKTLQEVIDATKDAVSTKWMNIFEDIFGNYEEAKGFWTDMSNILWDIFAGPLDAFSDATEIFKEHGGMEAVHETILEIIQVIADLFSTVQDVINLFIYGTDDADEVAEKQAEIMLNIINALRSAIKRLSKFINGRFRPILIKIFKIVASVVNVFRSFGKIIKTAFSSLKNGLKSGLKGIFSESAFSDAEDKLLFLEVIAGKIQQFADWLSDSKAFIRIENWFSDFGKVIGKALKYISGLPRKISDGFKKLTGKSITDVLKSFLKIVSAIANAFKSLGKVIKTAFLSLKNGLKGIFSESTFSEAEAEDKLSFLEVIAGKIQQFADWLSNKNVLNWITDNFYKFGTKIGKALKFIGSLPNRIASGFQKLTGKSISDVLKSFWEKIKAAFQWVSDQHIFSKIWTRIKAVFSFIGEGLKSLAGVETYGELFEKIRNVVIKVKDKLVSFFKTIRGFFSKKDKDSPAAAAEEATEAIASVTHGGGTNKGALYAPVTMMSSALKIVKPKETKEIEENSEKVITFADRIKVFLSKLGSALKVVFRGISKLFTWLGKLFTFDGFREISKVLMTGIKDVIIYIGDITATIIKQMFETIKNIDLAKLSVIILLVKSILDEFKSLVKILILKDISTSIRKISVAIKWLAGVPSDLAVAQKFRAFAYIIQSIGLLLISLGAAIFIIAKAIQTLGNIDKNALIRGGIAIGAILLAVAGFVIALVVILGKFAKTSSYHDITKFSKTESHSSGTSKGNNMAGIITAIALMLLSLAVVIDRLAKTIVMLARIDDPKKLWSAGGVVFLLLALVMAFCFALLSMLKTNKEGLLKTGGSKNELAKNAQQTIKAISALLLSLSASVFILALAIKMLAGIEDVNALQRSAVIVMVLVGFLMFFCMAIVGMLDSSTKKTKKTDDLAVKIASVALLLLSLGAAMVIISKAIAILSLFDSKKVLIAAGIFAGILALLGILILIAKSANPAVLLSLTATMLSLGATILLFAVAINLLIPAIYALNHMGIKTALKAAGSILLILGAIALGGVIIKYGLPGLLGFAAVVAVLAVSFTVFSAGVAVLATSLSLLSVSLVAFAASVVASAPVISAATQLMVETLVLAISTFVEGMLQMLIEKSALIGELISVQIQMFFKIIQDSAAGFAETVVAIVLAVLDALTKILPSLAEFVFNGLVVILSTLADHMGDIVSAVLDILLALINTLAEYVGPIVTAVANFIGKLVDALIDNLPTIFGSFVDYIVVFFESTLGAVLTGIFTSFGKSLSAFAESAKPFFDALKDIDADALQAVAMLGEMILMLTAASFLDALQKFASFGKGESALTKFGKDLAAFADPLNAFANKTSGIDGKKVESVAAAAKAMAELYRCLPREDGWAQKLAGEVPTLASFGDDLEKFALSFRKFYQTIPKKVDQAVVEATAIAAKTMASIYEYLPKTGGWAQDVMGEVKTLSEFGDELKEFAIGFKMFYNELPKDLDVGIVESAAIAAKAMAGLYDNLPKEGGLMQDIFGETMSLKAFGEDLKDFATGFVNFYSILYGADIQYGIVRMATYAGQALAGLYEKMPKQGGVLQKIFGETMSLKDFGNDLDEFGSGFARFYAHVGDLNISQDAVDAIGRAGQSLANLYLGLNGQLQEGKTGNFAKDLWKQLTSWVSEKLPGGKTPQDVVNSAVDIALTVAKGLLELQQKYPTLNETKVNSITNAMSQLIACVNAMSGDGLKNSQTFSSNVTNALGSLLNNIANLTNSTFNGTAQKITDYLAISLASKIGFMADSRSNSYKNFTEASKKFADAFCEILKGDLYVNLVDIGYYIAEGFAQGVENTTEQVEESGVRAGKAFEEGARDSLGVKSPSRVMMTIGQFVGEGFIRGVGSYQQKVYDSAQGMGFSAIDGMSKAIQSTKDILSDNLDSSMVITPVLDLSQIQNGASAISSMMESASGYAVDGTFSYANRAASSRSASSNDSSTFSVDKLTGAIEDLIRNPQSSISNNFTINSNADPKEIANEVSRIIQTQVERRQAVWGR